MDLYSYVVTHDTGFSPNPFLGCCTLACCKPAIRRKAQKGDWIVGLTPKRDGNRVVYFMKVEESMGFDAYWRDPRFSQKKPKLHAGIDRKNGDNIYEPQAGGGYRQLPSRHSNPPFGKREDRRMKERDLGGERVLVSQRFAYFGSKPSRLPRELECLIVGRGHRCRFSDKTKAHFRRFVGRRKLRVHAPPRHWPPGDESWKGAAHCSV
jgi:hypothetical protein